jgi:nucleoid-associated protein YgaU
MIRWHPFSPAAHHSHNLWPAFALVTASLCASLPAIAQDVAEAARQEKARKANHSAEKRHVYTNDDLKQSQILTEKDRDRVQARKFDSGPAVPPAPVLDTSAESSADSLGEIARRYHREKSAHAAEQARLPQSPSFFRMNVRPPVLASPAPLGPPLVAPTPLRAPRIVKPAPPAIAPAPPKRDPFARPSFSPSLRSSAPRVAPPPVAPRISPAPRIIPAHSAPRALPAPHIAPAPNSYPAVNSAPRIAPPPPAHRAVSAPTDQLTGVVTIRPGDTLWKLSQHYLGTASRWHEWLARNPAALDPYRLRPGTSLLIPQANDPPPTQTPGKWTVQKGDSLWKIAAAHLGHGSAWSCLASANPQLRDFRLIYPGQSLLLPATCSASAPASP